MEAVARLDNVTVRFGVAEVLTTVSLKCVGGRVLSLVGPNGSGKTTTLHVAVGLLTPTTGSATINGRPPSDHRSRRSLGFVPDASTGLDELTIDEYLQLYARLHKNDRALERARSLLVAFGLDGRRDSTVASLSMGMRRQVTICAAASIKPDLFVIDEATATLDPEAIVVLRSILSELAAAGSAVLAATQDLNFAQTVSDDVVLISQGAVARSGPLAELLREEKCDSLEELFLSAVDHSTSTEEVSRALTC